MSRANINRWVGTLSTNIANAVLGLATGVLVARLLLPEGRGELAVVMFWPMLIASVGTLSIPAAVTHLRASDGSYDHGDFTSTVFWVSIALSLCVGAFGYALIPWLLTEEELTGLTQLYLVLLILPHVVSLNLLGIDHGRLRFRRFNLVRLLPQAGYLAGLCVIWSFGAVSVENVLFCHVAGVALTAAVRLLLHGDELGFRFSSGISRGLFSTGIRFHGAGCLGLVRSQADRFVLITFFDDAAIGLYVVALTYAAAPVGMLSGAFGTLLFPRISGAEEPEEKNRLLAQSVRAAIVLFVIVGAIFTLVAGWVIPFLFGSAFGFSARLAYVLVPAAMLLSLRDIYLVALLGFGDWRIRSLSEVVMLVAFAGLAAALVDHGSFGLAAALGIAALISLIATIAAMRVTHDFDITDHLRLIKALREARHSLTNGYNGPRPVQPPP